MYSEFNTFLMISVIPKRCFATSNRPPDCASSRRIFRITEIEGGLPHSEILGSKLVRSSPRLIAAYHVLHRLSAPRHPPNALMTLDCSHYRRPPHLPLGRGRVSRPSFERRTWTIDRKDHFCFERIRERRGQAAPTTGDCSRCDPKNACFHPKAEALWR
jgi:hypothetical protein